VWRLSLLGEDRNNGTGNRDGGVIAMRVLSFILSGTQISQKISR
jgi:hypothetical protein